MPCSRVNRLSPYFKDFKSTMEKDYNGEFSTPDEFIFN